MDIYTKKLTGFSIGLDNVYSEIASIVAPFGRKVLIIGGETAMEKALPTLLKYIEGTPLVVLDTIIYGKECTMANGKRLAALPVIKEADMIFAIGGGKAIDTVKIINGECHLPYFTFPTIASTCAAYTEVAAVYKDNHEFDCAYYCGEPARHTFINTRIIAEAPEKFIWAGMGDTVAKYYESNLSARGLNVPYNVSSGCLYSAMCVEPLYKYGKEAFLSAKKKEVSEALEQVVLAIIVGTGMAAVLLPEDFNSSIGHAVCYGLTTRPEIEATALHGEMVAYGVLVLLTVDKQYEERNKLLKLYKELNLPCNLNHFNLTLDQLEGILAKAVSTRDTKVGPYKVTEDMLLEAIKELEELPC